MSKNDFSLPNDKNEMNKIMPNIFKINQNDNKPATFKLDNKTKKDLLLKHARMLELQDIMEKQNKRNHFLKLNFQKHELIKQRRKLVERQRINENIFVLKDIRQEKQNIHNSNLLNLDLSINATHLKTLQEEDKILITNEIKKDVFLTKVKEKELSREKDVNTSFNVLNNSKLARLYQTEDIEKKINLHKRVKEDELSCLYKKMKNVYKNEDENIYNNLSFVAFQINNVEPTKDLYNLDKKRFYELKKRQKIEFLAKLSSNYDAQNNSKHKNYSKININNKRKCLEDKIKMKKELIEMEVTKTYINNMNQINLKSKINEMDEIIELDKKDVKNEKEVESDLHTISFKNEIISKNNDLEYKKILPKVIKTKSYTPFEMKNNIFRNDSLANSLNYYRKYPDSKINNLVFRKIRSNSSIEKEKKSHNKLSNEYSNVKLKRNMSNKIKNTNTKENKLSDLSINLQEDSKKRKCLTPGKKITVYGKLAELKYLIISSNQKGEAYSMKYNIDKFMRKNKISKEIARKILGDELCDTFL